MNHLPRSRLLLPGVSAMFFFALALSVAASAELAPASKLKQERLKQEQLKPLKLESATNQAAASRKDTHTIQLDETLVSGNQELPKVLYILPWQQPDGIPEIALESEAPELEVFRRLYPPAYRRELNYYEQLQAAGTEK